MKHQESIDQQALFNWARFLSVRYPALKLMFHIPNGQKLAGSPLQRAKTAMRLKSEGMKPGVPDICLPVPSAPFHGLFIEMKRKNGGKVSSEQQDWIDNLQAQGYRALVCKGVDEAQRAIIEYLDLR